MKSYSLSAFKIRLINSILTDVFKKSQPLDKVYAVYFKKLKLESPEQALIVKIINDLMRRLNYYAYIAGYHHVKDAKNHVNRLIQVIHLVHNWPIPELSDTEGMSIHDAKKRMEEANASTNLRLGCPVWLDEVMSKALGEERWEKEKEAFATEPERFIRVNTLKTNLKDVRNSLHSEGIRSEEVPGMPDALHITSDGGLFRTTAFKNGWFEQQDIGSQAIAPFLQPAPGLKIIDACAGAGGKTMHLAALTKGKGVIIALDDAPWKLKELKERAKRAGAFNIETRPIENNKVIKRLHASADRVLLDVPCSGSGVLKRNTESKWQDRSLELTNLLEIQAEILKNYSSMVRKNGLLVYSTCSILPDEDHNQIEKFLKEHNDFVLEEERTIYPSEGGDGFFMARLKRISGDDSRRDHNVKKEDINASEDIKTVDSAEIKDTVSESPQQEATEQEKAIAQPEQNNAAKEQEETVETEQPQSTQNQKSEEENIDTANNQADTSSEK